MGLRIENLSVSFVKDGLENQVLKNVNIEIKDNEWVGLAGETGSGKTTLLRSILKLLPENAKVKEGNVFFNGKDLLSRKEKEIREIRGKEIFLIIQEPHLYFNPLRKIFPQIVELLLSHKLEKYSVIKDRIYYYLEILGLDDPQKLLESYSFQLSSGMLQRLGIALALIVEPKIILADEPTSSLDNVHEKQIMNILKNLKKNERSLVFVTHKIDLLKEIVEKVGILYKGSLVEYGDTEDLFSEPLHPYSCFLLRKTSYGKIVFSELKDTQFCPFFHSCPFKFSLCKDPPPIIEKNNGRRVRCWMYFHE